MPMPIMWQSDTLLLNILICYACITNKLDIELLKGVKTLNCTTNCKQTQSIE